MQKLLITSLLVLFSALIAAPQSVAGETVYRWVDKEGNVHFSDRAPEGVQAERLDVKPNVVALVPAGGSKPAGSEIPADEDGQPQLSYAEQRRADRANARSEYAEESRNLESQCQTMRSQKTFFESRPRVHVDDGDGGQRMMDDDERMGLLAEANDFIAENCN